MSKKSKAIVSNDEKSVKKPRIESVPVPVSILNWNDRVYPTLCAALDSTVPIHQLCRVISDYAQWKPRIRTYHKTDSGIQVYSEGHLLADSYLPLRDAIQSVVVVPCIKDGKFRVNWSELSGLSHDVGQIIPDPIRPCHFYAITSSAIYDLNTKLVQWSLLAGEAHESYELKDGKGPDARFNDLGSIVCSSDGSTVYVTDTYNHCLRSLNTTTYDVSTVTTPTDIRRIDSDGFLSGVLHTPVAMAMYRGPAHAPDSVLYICSGEKTGAYPICRYNLLTREATDFPVTEEDNCLSIDCTPTGILIIGTVNAIIAADASTGTTVVLHEIDESEKDPTRHYGHAFTGCTVALCLSDKYQCLFSISHESVQRISLSPHLFVCSN